VVEVLEEAFLTRLGVRWSSVSTARRLEVARGARMIVKLRKMAKRRQWHSPMMGCRLDAGERSCSCWG